MRKFTVPCNFSGQISNFSLYIGEPDPKRHPVQHQADWLSKERGGTVPKEVMDSLEKLHQLSIKNNVSFEELCAYALESAYDDEQKFGEKNNQDNK